MPPVKLDQSQRLAQLQKRIRHNYNQSAAGYNENALLQAEVASRIADDFSLFSVKPNTVLDLGCGTGFLSQHLASQYPDTDIIGIDFAENMCHIAANFASQLADTADVSQHTNQPYVLCADVMALPLADDSVDIVASNLLLHWLLDIPAFLRECNRVLKKDGLIVFTTLGAHSLAELAQAWQTIDNKSHTNPMLGFQDIGDLLIECGYCQPVVHQEHITLTYQTPQQLLHDIKRMGGHTWFNRPQQQGLMGKERYQQLCDGLPQAPDEPIYPLTFEVVYAHAWLGEEIIKGPNRDRSHINEITLEEFAKQTTPTTEITDKRRR